VSDQVNRLAAKVDLPHTHSTRRVKVRVALLVFAEGLLAFSFVDWISTFLVVSLRL